ncbi:MAG: hypothetical protein QOI88_3945 [Gammaproteobacteria bacterium]|jgi:hypothetical protein|nr:hypothetical protein [Gammaproteobacteria bacterium]
MNRVSVKLWRLVPPDGVARIAVHAMMCGPDRRAGARPFVNGVGVELSTLPVIADPYYPTSQHAK